MNSDAMRRVQAATYLEPAKVAAILRAARAGDDIHTIARAIGLGRPAVHSVVFDLRRAGFLPRKRRTA